MGWSKRLAALTLATIAISAAIGACAAAGSVTGQSCVAGLPSQTWQLHTDGTLRSSAGACLTASAAPSSDSGDKLSMEPCANASSSAAALQEWEYSLGTGMITLKGATGPTCANLQGYGTSPGTPVWLYNPCTTGSGGVCKGNCQWSFPVPGNTTGLLTNSASGLCLDDGSAGSAL